MDRQSIVSIPGSLLICKQSCSSQFPLVPPQVPSRPVFSWGKVPDRERRDLPVRRSRGLWGSPSDGSEPGPRRKRHLEHAGAQAALPLSAPAAVLFAALQVRERSARDAGRHGAHPLLLPV